MIGKIKSGVLLLLLPVVCSAANTDDVKLLELSGDRAWRALLHYESSRLQPDVDVSAINSSQFFLAAEGKTDPLAELKATVSGLQQSVTEPDKHVQCLYPARYRWLRQHLPVIEGIQQIDCPGFSEWLDEESIQSVSMLFAVGHMKSPASYFGHNFLKFNGEGANRTNNLLDPTINFGAEVPENELGITYFVQGIFGGYSAVFERQPFFRHMAKYGEEDLRDVWEYELELSEQELNLILAHAWELQRASFTYFFFRENCAYQIASLLELVTPAQFVPKFMPWTMPYNVSEGLAKARLNGKPLVRSIRYHPSRRSRFHQRYFSLSSVEKALFTVQVADRTTLQSELFEEQGFASQIRVIDALLDYYEFRLRLDMNDVIAADEKKKILLRRFSLPVSQSENVTPAAPFAPHLAQRPGLLSLAAVSNKETGNAVVLRVRPAYFDFLALDMGRSSSGEFSVLDTELLIDGDNISLGKFDLLNLTNLAPSVTGVPGDTGNSWHFRLGFDQPDNACSNCLNGLIDGRFGKATKLSQSLTGYALAGVRVQSPHDGGEPVALQLSAGLAGELVSGVHIHAAAERHESAAGGELDRNRIKLDLRFGSHRTWDIRVSYSREFTEEFSLSAGYYW